MLIEKVEISHPEKIMIPDLNVTKQEIAEYYAFIAENMLPYIKNRALSLKQYPAGISREGFFHKHAAEFYPEYIKRFTFPTPVHGNIEMVGVDSARGLVYLAGQNTIELHMALATMRTVNKPDQIIFDLDPSDNDFSKVRTVALIIKEILDQHKLKSLLKTTGSRGLHIHIPLKPKLEYDEVKPITKQLAAYVQEQCPEIATIEHRKAKRGTRVFIDYLRNDYTATAVAPYSLRANKWGGIATPISWDELKNNNDLTPYKYNIRNIEQRIKTTKNPWLD
jgi:bifunctional non-homologous end joining protein LigD